MVKAKDLLDKTQDEFEEPFDSAQDKDPLDKQSPEDEDEKVNEAYETLSKKLETLRKDSNDDDDDDDDDVNEDIDEPESEKESDSEDGPKETFTKAQEDPLDKDDNLTEKEVENLNKSETAPEDSLDDLAKEEPKGEDSSLIHRLGDSNKDRYFNETSQVPENNPFSQKYSGLTRPKGSSKLHIFILALIGLAIIGGTVYLLRSQFGEQTTTSAPSPEVSIATATPQPTPEAVDRTKFKVRVLNGTTQTGLAASVSAKLKDLGYQTDKLGNATNSAFLQTVVRAKPSASGLIEQLIKDLTGSFEAASSDSALKDSDPADAEVILGVK